MTRRVFCDTGILIRYFAEDDIPRALAAANLIDEPDVEVLVSTGVLIELVHAMRTGHGVMNPTLAEMLITFLTRENVRLVDADAATVVASLGWSQQSSARRIADVILAAAAERAGCDFIASFDEKFSTRSVPVRLL